MPRLTASRVRRRSPDRPMSPVSLLILAFVHAVTASSDVSIISTASSLDPAALVLQRHISSRSTSTTVRVNATAAAVRVRLALSDTLGAETYMIAQATADSIEVVVSGGGVRGVLFGVGALLRNASFNDGKKRGFSLGSWRGGSAPALSDGFRAMYLATHLGNFYVSAPVPAVQQVMEDLALWGANTVVFAFPTQDFTSFKTDPALLALMDKQAALYRAAQSIGLKIGIITSNQGLQTRPKNISACTDYHLKLDHFQGADFKYRVSVAKTGGLEYLIDNHRQWFSGWKERGVKLDFLVVWPYDNGGSGCQGEWPWGALGHAKLSAALSKLGKATFPGLRTVVSMWGYDLDNSQQTKDFGEYSGLEAFIDKSNSGAIDFTMTDSGLGYPQWPLTHHRGPGGLPLLNFPEISMHFREPWGGTGANPMPTRLQALWEPVKGLVTGGMPYSEGIYEDLNQVICQQHYWNASITASDTLRQYVASQFCKRDRCVAFVVEAIGLLEETFPMGNPAKKQNFPPYPLGPDGPCYSYHCGCIPHCIDTSRSNRSGGSNRCARALLLLQQAEVMMQPEAAASWRWRLLMDRALIDAGMFDTVGKPPSAAVRAAMADIQATYYMGCPGSSAVCNCTGKSPSASCPGPWLKPLTPAQVTCNNVPPHPGGNGRNYSTCARDSRRGQLVPWVISTNISNVYGDCGPQGGPVTPLLGIFSTAEECQAACEANPNCTQYGWASAAQTASAQWTHRCFGRCDTSWQPHNVSGTVWGRRVQVRDSQ